MGGGGDGGGWWWCKVIFMSNPTSELSWGVVTKLNMNRGFELSLITVGKLV